jgi:hypothetical protein
MKLSKLKTWVPRSMKCSVEILKPHIRILQKNRLYPWKFDYVHVLSRGIRIFYNCLREFRMVILRDN